MAHYDLAAAEAQARADMKAQGEIGDAAVKRGQAEPGFIRAQREFDEARLQFFLAPLRASNAACSPEDVLAGAGVALGLMYASIVSSVSDHGGDAEATLQYVDAWAQKTLHDALDARVANRSNITKVTVKPEEGGHA